MTIALVVVTAMYLMVAGLVALNSAFEVERPLLAAADVAVIALVSTAWPFIACALLSALARRKLSSWTRELLPAAR